jgi:hypothetical protein
MDFQLFDNELFKFALVRDESTVKTQADGTFEYTVASVTLFRCECYDCVLTSLAAMQNIMNHFKKEHGITEADVAKQLNNMGGAGEVKPLARSFH